MTPADIAPENAPKMFADYATEAAIQRSIDSNSAISSETYRAALHCLVSFNRLAELPSIACPTLVLAAEKDTAAPPRGMRRMAEKIPGAVYHEIPGAGHLANLERPGVFNRAIGDFLAGLGPPAPGQFG